MSFYNELRTKASDSTVKKVHTMLHGCFADARHADGSFRNPCDLPKKQKPKYRPASEAMPFDAVKEAAFLKACDGHPFEALFMIALDAGMRQGELLALEWRDVDLTRGCIEVRQSLTDTEDGVAVGPCKNRQRRSIKVGADTIAALEVHRKRQARDRMQRLVFPNAVGGYLSRQNFNRRSFAEVLKLAQEQSRLDFTGHTFHDLRHTMACLLLQEGEAITRVSQRLGHASVATTLKYYAQALPNDEASPANRFDKRRALAARTARKIQV